MDLVAEWQCLYFVAIGMSDAWLLERYANDMGAEGIQRIRALHEEMSTPS